MQHYELFPVCYVRRAHDFIFLCVLWLYCQVTLYSCTGIILAKGSVNKRRRYHVTSSLIGWTHSQNYPIYSVVYCSRSSHWHNCNIANCQLNNLEWYGKVGHYLTTKKHNKVWTMGIYLRADTVLAPNQWECNAVSHWLDPRLAPSQWETSAQSNAVSHWLIAKPRISLAACDTLFTLI